MAVPGELVDEDLLDARVVVVDAVRATTTLLTALEAGAARAYVVPSVEEALELRRAIGDETVVLCGERGGRKIEGFDLGNSPSEFSAARVGGKILVCTTTNGTRVTRRCEGATELWLGCFRNRAAVVDLIARGRSGLQDAAADRVVVACAGVKGRLGLDDLLCAGLIVEGLLETLSGLHVSDGARAALAAAREVGAPSAGFLATTAAGQSLVDVGLEQDLVHCAELDVSRFVPCRGEGGFVLEEPAAARGS